MRRIALDTNAYVAFKRGDSETLAIIRQTDQLGMSSIVLGELLAGFACGDRAAFNRRELSAFLDSPRVQVLEIGSTTADYYAHIFATLKAKGRPIPTNDLWIAASALEHGFALHTYDRHFYEIENLPSGRILDDFLP
jgi:tRNA(fMet)-specific endonuclease VapC